MIGEDGFPESLTPEEAGFAPPAEPEDRFQARSRMQAESLETSMRGPASEPVDEDSAPLTLSLEEAQGLPTNPDGFPDSLSLDQVQGLQVSETLRGAPSERLAQNVGNGPVTIGDAFNSIKAADYMKDGDNGIVDRAFYALGIPEQMIARQATNALENVGLMTTEDARALLSQDQVHGHDLVNHYWRESDSSGPTNTEAERSTKLEAMFNNGARMVTGFGVDMLLDPLNYVGIGEAKNAINIAGKTINNLSKVSKTERAWYKTLSAIEGVIDQAGKVKWKNEALGATKDAVTSKQALGMLRDGLLGFDDFVGGLSLGKKVKGGTEALRESVTEARRLGMTQKTTAEMLRSGDKTLTLGFSVPFTNIAMETAIPGGKIVGKALGAVAYPLGLAKKVVESTSAGRAAYSILSDLSTKTGKYLFDAQQNTNRGTMEAIREGLGEFEKEGRTIFKTIKDSIGDDQVFQKVIDDFVEEIEMRPLSLDEAANAAAKHGRSAEEALVLATATPRDAERAGNLAKHPQLTSLVDQIIENNSALVKEYKTRNIPFEELNPFGPGWSRRYIKHVVTNDWYDVAKKTGVAGDEVTKAMDMVASKVGKVDQSALGRSYRGTIKEANIAAMEEHGVKMFVDDPFELIRRRHLEMSRVIQNHDLFDAASAYAVKGKAPGTGWVKFDPNDFGKLTLEQKANFGSDDMRSTFSQFVPDFFKEGKVIRNEQGLGKKVAENIYLPDDIYDRLQFEVNGHDLGPRASQMFKAAEAFTSLWKNNALFGAGYLGLNAFSNTFTYVNYNGLKSVDSLANATRVILGSADNFAFRTAEGTAFKMSGTQIMKEAIEDNIMKSSVFSEINMDELAEHMASNRETRKTVFGKAKNLADYAYLWRLNRHVAEKTDSVFKLGTYMARRQQGFSRGAAAEAAERYFYNFNLGSRSMDVASNVIPFSRFPMKTMEMVVEQFRNGAIGKLTVSDKVQHVLEGGYVEDSEVRDALNEVMPDYNRIKHPIHGAIMPGMREVLFEVPTALSTINMLFAPEQAIHPVAQIIYGLGAWKAADSGVDADQNQDSVMRAWKKNVDMLIPAYLREALTVYDINTGNLGGYYRDDFKPTMSTDKADSDLIADKQTIDMSAVAQKFEHSKEFGESLKGNWLYDLVFSNGEGLSDGKYKDQQMGTQGEFIRRRYRQMTLGLGSMTKLDQNFLTNHWALGKQIDAKKKKLVNDIYESGALLEAGRINDPGFQKELAKTRPEAKELIALQSKRDALAEYYDFVLSVQATDPTINLATVLGFDDTRMDTSDKPLVHDMLTIKAGKIADEEADEYTTDLLDDAETPR